MDAGPLTGPAPPPNWGLKADVAVKAQGFVSTGFGALPTGRALFLEFKWLGDVAPGWLGRLRAVAPITSAVWPTETAGEPPKRAASIAFTGTGLRRMGLPGPSLASFTRPFQEGMFQEDRLRRIGDRRDGVWCDTVVAGGPVWSANTPVVDPSTSDGLATPPTDLDKPIETATTVHALLLLYALDEPAAEAWANEVREGLANDAVAVVRQLELVLDVQTQQSKFSREHFGFADGLSQPIPYDCGKGDVGGPQEAGVIWTDSGTQDGYRDPVQGVPLGEFVFGYINGHQEIAPGPIIVDDERRYHIGGLERAAQAEGFRDLGLNGSYLVVRELKQNVAAFWRSMRDNAAAVRASDPAHSQHITEDWIAQRVIGRELDGHLMCPGNTKLPACTDNSPDSSFLFRDRDMRGTGCPPGSHLRRAFPRDSLAPHDDDGPTLLQAANNHRILRRGRKFGTKLDRDAPDDGADRGLLFMCLNTDIERQFEFVQQTWLLNSSFATLFKEVDPLVGPDGPMTVRDDGLRRIVKVDTFVQMVGGDYFFLPSLPALDLLGSL